MGRGRGRESEGDSYLHNRTHEIFIIFTHTHTNKCVQNKDIHPHLYVRAVRTSRGKY